MGIPGFYRWLCQRYPLSRRRLDQSRPTNCQNLYIDANTLLYSVAQNLGMIDVVVNESFKHRLAILYDSIVQLSKPTDLIYISFDGVSPTAKQLKSRLSNYDEPNQPKSKYFEYRPGTQVMDDVMTYISEFIESKRTTDPLWSKPEVILSTVYTPGEGEHKIFDHIRTLPSTQGDIFIYSNDADLYLMALLQSHSIVIMRDQVIGDFQKIINKTVPRTIDNSLNYEVMSIDIIKEYMQLDFNPDDFHAFVLDFIALTCVVGNDFIPCFPFVSFKLMGDDLIDAYKETKEKLSAHFVVDGKINREFLATLLTKISNLIEDADPEPFKEYLEPTEELLTSMGRNYVTMYEFVLSYYQTGIPSWTYSFRYPILPIIPLLIPYLNVESEEYTLGEPLDPYFLMLYGPPMVGEYAPVQIRELMTPGSPIGQYYPSEFKTYKYGFTYKDDYYPIVPVVDGDVLLPHYNEAIGKMTEEELELNRIEEVQVFDCGEKDQLLPISKPTLYSIKFESALEKIGISVFAGQSKSSTVILKFAPNSEGAASTDADQWVLTGYPYFQPVKITGEAQQPIEELIEELMIKHGIIVDGETRGLSVVSVTGERFNVISSLIFPFDEGFTKFLDNTKPLYVGSPVVIVDGEYQGKSGVVLAINGETADIKVINKILSPSLQSPLQRDRKNWLKLGDLVKPLGATIRTLRAILGGITVYDSKDEEIQVGLKLTKFTTQEHIEWWVKKGNQEDLYNSGLQPLLEEYFRQTGNLKNYLNNHLKTTKLRDLHITASDLFTADPDARLKGLVEWLSENSPTADFSLISDNWISLSFSTLKKFEEELMRAELREPSFVVEHIPFSDIVWPGSALKGEHECPNLGEKVIGMSTRMIELFGKAGYVVGKDNEEKEVAILLIEEAEWGTDLRGQLDSFRLVKLNYDEIIAVHRS